MTNPYTYNGVKLTTYKDGSDIATGTPALGSIFENEYLRIYEDLNYEKYETDDLQAKHTALVTGVPATLDTLAKIASALNNDASYSVTANLALTTHTNSNITSVNTVHGIRQGSSFGFDADMVDGKHALGTNAATDITINNATQTLSNKTLASTTTFNATTGTAPFIVSSITKITNLNADLLDGYTTGNSTGQIPISNSTVNTNLNSEFANGQKFNFSNSSNSPTYFWSADSTGTAYLASRTAVSVNYSTTSGSSAACTGNAATATLATNSSNAYACSGNSNTATTATLATNANNAYACSGNAATATNSDTLDTFHAYQTIYGTQVTSTNTVSVRGPYGQIINYCNSGVYTPAIVGIGYGSTNTVGIYGESDNASGVSGVSNTGYGIQGNSGNIGVYGTGTGYGTGVSGNGLTGVSGTGVTGVYGSGLTYGIQGNGPTGIYGTGTNTGIYGVSNSNVGVEGLGGYIGVRGQGNTGYGVYGIGGNYGVYGTGINGVYGYTSVGVSVGGNTGYNSTSSTFLKYKEKISIIEILKSTPLNVYKYIWEDANYKGFSEFIGPIAEDIQNTFKLTSEKDGLYTVDGIALGLGIELLEKIELLELENIELKTKLNDLEVKLNKLLNR